MRELSRSPSAVLARAKKKEARGEKLTLTERNRLDAVRAMLADRAEAGERRAMRAETRKSQPETAHFAVTKHGLRLVINETHPGGPWSSGDELEVVCWAKLPVWVTLVKLVSVTSLSDQWWTYLRGRKSQMKQHVAKPLQDTLPPAENKADACALDDDEKQRVSTGAGAAYLAARKKKAAGGVHAE